MNFFLVEPTNLLWAFELHRPFEIDSAIYALLLFLLIWLFNHLNNSTRLRRWWRGDEGQARSSVLSLFSNFYWDRRAFHEWGCSKKMDNYTETGLMDSENGKSKLSGQTDILSTSWITVFWRVWIHLWATGYWQGTNHDCWLL